MFPKAFLYGSRAATHIHQAANHPFRNVLQLQTLPLGSSAPSSGSILSLPGAASSSWGAGGSQYSTYQGYTGVGRAITQVNSASTGDGNRDQSDDTEEPPISHLILRRPFRPITHLPPRRSRSASFTLPSDSSRPLNDSRIFGLIQRQQRLKHTMLALSCPEDPSVDASAPHSRRCSSSLATAIESSIPPETPPISFADGLSTPTSPSRDKRLEDPDGSSKAIEIYIESALKACDYSQLSSLLDRHGLRNEAVGHSAGTLSASVFNKALIALAKLRPKGEPSTGLLQVYNAAVSRAIVPSTKAYHALIEALIDRDVEVQAALSRIDVSLRNSKLGLSENAQDLHSLREVYITERAYESAVALFDAIGLLEKDTLPPRTVSRLIKCCAFRADLNAALRLFSSVDKTLLGPDTSVYAALIDVYKASGDLAGAEEVYEGFSNQRLAPSLGVERDTRIQDHMIGAYIELGHPEKGLELLGHMMDHGSRNGYPPLPTQHTFSRILRGFSSVGDVDSALKWYNRLNQQISDPSIDSSSIRPTPDMWMSVFQALSQHGSLDDVNAFMGHLLHKPTPFTGMVQLRSEHLELWLALNVQSIEASPPEKRVVTLQCLAEYLSKVLENHFSDVLGGDASRLITGLANIAVDEGLLVEAVQLIRPVANAKAQLVSKLSTQEADNRFRIFGVQMWTNDFFTKLLSASASTKIDPKVAFYVALETGHLVRHIGRGDNGAGDLIADLYPRGAPDPKELSPRNWELITNAFCDAQLRRMESADALLRPTPDINRLIADMSAVDEDNLSLVNFKRLAETLQKVAGRDAAYSLLSSVGPSALSHFISSDTASSPTLVSEADTDSSHTSHLLIPDIVPPVVRLDVAHSRFVDEHHSNSFARQAVATPLQCFERFEQGSTTGTYPYPQVLGRLINALGRIGEIDKVQRVYAAAQLVLQSLESRPDAQTSGWFTIEDQMMAALAHSGNMEAANVHRMRILQHGGAPSADSYGALIAAVKDTSDDSTMAQELFEESSHLKVVPNIYLYNTVISKLAKARKTDYALELFHQMPHVGIRPTAVTFAAVIGACCRVGDEESAIYLFEQMVNQPRYQPRVPVYNNMIQFFVNHGKDRDRALRYYRMLLGAGLRPTQHTYKLLLDAYGSIEPVDVSQVESTFAELCKRFVPQGAHWASVINAWGSGVRDVEKAISLFNSIDSPEIRRDAVVYESLLSTLFLNDRSDLVPEYLKRMGEDAVHMTAYVANVLIRGYAKAGDIQKARDIFESLADSPVGVAAPHNHGPATASGRVPMDAPVYREPSSWETMITMELEFGVLANAESLMDRFAARMFPPAVTNRVRSILVNYETSGIYNP